MVEPFSSICDHDNKIINNNNYLTCITCGLEIEQIFCHPDIYAHDSIIFTLITDFNARKLEEVPTFTKNSKIVSGKTKEKVVDLIDKVIRQLYLPEYLKRETYDHFLDLRSECTRKSNLELASFAFYDYLKWQNIGRSHKEIIQVTKITRKILKVCEKVNTKSTVYNTPKSI